MFVDDVEHTQDLVLAWRRALKKLEPLHTRLEDELRDILSPGVDDIREWLRSGCFDDHLKRYSKSRRKAPIYWQLSLASASYSVWLYYHRLTKDTFYEVQELAKGKLEHEERRLTSLVQGAGGTSAASQRKEVAEQDAFVEELRTFREEVARIAPLWNPDLNDGVIVNSAPLWRLVPKNRAWQKECRTCWDKLVAGGYDWAHLAMHLWPERVVPKCVKDRSIAIAHRLDYVFWEEDDKGKWQSLKVPQHEIDQLIAERTSAAVKHALNSLLEAPAPILGRAGGRRSSARSTSRRKSTGPKSINPSASTPSSVRSKLPDTAVLDAMKKVIAEIKGGAGKADVLSATGLTDGQWNVAINTLIADRSVTKSGAGRGTRYHPRLTTDD